MSKKLMDAIQSNSKLQKLLFLLIAQMLFTSIYFSRYATRVSHTIIYNVIRAHNYFNDLNLGQLLSTEITDQILPTNDSTFQNPFRRPLQRNGTAIIGNPLDFDLVELFDDKILNQVQWMVKFSRTKQFQELKPKRLLVQDGYKNYYTNWIGIHCRNDSKDWASKCLFKLDSSKSTNETNLEQFDAVFNVRNWVKRAPLTKLPNSTKQVFYMLESPYTTPDTDLSTNNAFLASYWRGSDVPIPYARYYPFTRKEQQEQNQSHNENSTDMNDPRKIKNYASGRKKLATIVVSDCAPYNDRLGYVKELQRHITVDIYGTCGKLNCTEPCFENLKKDYKFYLAFENSNCRDYITEKLFRNALQHDMVPVVLGAHKNDYLYVAPPNSFIHVEDFKSPATLAEFLLKLDRNDTMYNEYFRWKQYGQIREAMWDFFCRSCAALFMADLVPPVAWPKKTTWKSVNKCLPRGRWYWSRPNNVSYTN